MVEEGVTLMSQGAAAPPPPATNQAGS
jgi:hypothetical protein